jgi:hypothetical protein
MNLAVSKRLAVGGSAPSQLFPVGQCHQLVEDFLQSLKTTFVIPHCGVWLLSAAMQVQTVRLTNLCVFVPQYCDAFLDRVLLAERTNTGSRSAL